MAPILGDGEYDMWEINISAGCVAMCSLMAAGIAAIIVGGMVSHGSLGQLGLSAVGVGLTMMIMRDNQRTRRMLRRPGESLGPIRTVPSQRD